jgi:hypothetical protein
MRIIMKRLFSISIFFFWALSKLLCAEQAVRIEDVYGEAFSASELKEQFDVVEPIDTEKFGPTGEKIAKINGKKIADRTVQRSMMLPLIMGGKVVNVYSHLLPANSPEPNPKVLGLIEHILADYNRISEEYPCNRATYFVKVENPTAPGDYVTRAQKFKLNKLPEATYVLTMSGAFEKTFKMEKNDEATLYMIFEDNFKNTQFRQRILRWDGEKWIRKETYYIDGKLGKAENISRDFSPKK